MYPKQHIYQPNTPGTLNPILLPSLLIGRMTIHQILDALLQLVRNVGALVEVQLIHLLDGIVDSQDEGGVGNGVLGGSWMKTIVRGIACSGYGYCDGGVGGVPYHSSIV